MECVSENDVDVMWRCREGDVWHGGAVEAGGCVRNSAGLGSISTRLRPASAVCVSWHVPTVQQDAEPRSQSVHLLRAAQRSVAATQLGCLRPDNRTWRQHAECRPCSSWRQYVGFTRRWRTSPLPRCDIHTYIHTYRAFIYLRQKLGPYQQKAHLSKTKTGA